MATTGKTTMANTEDDKTPFWIIALIIFGIAGLGGPIAFFFVAWTIK